MSTKTQSIKEQGLKPSRGFVATVKPYIKLCRIDGLLGVWLTFWPCAWGALLAGSYTNQHSPGQLLNILIGLFLGCATLHSAACIINDIFDRHVDSLVERTKHRPLVTGAVSVRNAWIFLGSMVLLFCYILTWTNPTCAKIALGNLPLQVIYPLSKRFTYWTSGILGLTFGYGSLVGWSAVTGSLCSVNIPLYAAGVCWAFGYDTIYAFQDKRDDPSAGVKSTAILFDGWQAKAFLSVLAVGFVSLLAVTGHLVDASPAFMFTIIASLLHVGWQVSTVDLNSPVDCFSKFYSNSWIGFVMLPGFILNYSQKLATH